MSIFTKLKKHLFTPYISVERMQKIRERHYQDFLEELSDKLKAARAIQDKEDIINQIFDCVCRRRERYGAEASYLTIGEFDFNQLIEMEVNQEEALFFCLCVKNIEIIRTNEEEVCDLDDDKSYFTDRHTFKIIFHLSDNEKIDIDYYHYYNDEYEVMYGMGISATPKRL